MHADTRGVDGGGRTWYNTLSQQRHKGNTMTTFTIVAIIAICYEAALGNADW